MNKFRQGFEDGSGRECVVDVETGHIIAVTNWGCSCCQSDTTDEHSARAAAIVAALNAGAK